MTATLPLACTPDLQHLKELALAASTSPWVDACHAVYQADHVGDDQICKQMDIADSAYVAAANPGVILALIAQIEAVAPQSVSVPEGWHGLIKWLLGENGSFPNRKSTNDGLYWWRKELRARYDELLASAPAAPLPQPQADGWIAQAMIGSQIASVAFKDEKTAKAMCVKGEPFAVYIDAWHSARLARTAAPSEEQRDQIIEEVALRIAETYDWSDARAPLADLMVMIRALKSDIAPSPSDKQAMNYEDMMALVNASPAIASGLPLAPAPLEAQPIPTDLSKRLQDLASSPVPFASSEITGTLLAAADEIDRYYGAALSWKRSAQAKDAEIGELRTTIATKGGAA